LDGDARARSVLRAPKRSVLRAGLRVLANYAVTIARATCLLYFFVEGIVLALQQKQKNYRIHTGARGLLD
jgi:hypothetical protein